MIKNQHNCIQDKIISTESLPTDAVECGCRKKQPWSNRRKTTRAVLEKETV